MSRNGSGVYALPQAAFVSGTVISSSAVNSDLSDIAAALTQSVSKDGQTVMTGNLPMGNNRLTSLANGIDPTDSVNLGQVVAGALNYAAAGGTANAITLAPSPGITAYAIGQRFYGKMGAAANTTAVTANVNGVGVGAVTWPNGTALADGDLPANAMFELIVQAVTPVFHLVSVGNVGVAATQAVGNTSTKIATTAFVSAALRSYLAGLTLSTAGSSGTFGIAVGQATDSTNLATIALTSAFTKTTSAWALGTGNGGIDTGAIANTTWYHAYLIKRPDTGVVDVTFSLNATTPGLPANYTLFRRIGSMKTDGSAQWAAFIQDGDLFQWLAPVADISSNNPGTSAVTRTLASVPTGLNVLAMVQALLQNVGTAGVSNAYLSDLATSDIAPTTSLSDVANIDAAAGATAVGSVNKSVRTNTSAQIRSRISFSDASCTLIINTLGWTDRRGRDS